jgi:hypothetical protein
MALVKDVLIILFGLLRVQGLELGRVAELKLFCVEGDVVMTLEPVYNICAYS